MFERALVPEPAAGHKRSFNSFLAAVAGHGLVIGALLAVGALAVQATNDPDVADYALSFIAPTPPPPAPPAPHRPYEVQQRAEVRETPKPRAVELPKVEQPKAPVVTAQVQPKLQMLEQTPEPEQVAATRPAEPEKPQIAAGGYGKLAATMDAPEVKVPGGGRVGPGFPHASRASRWVTGRARSSRTTATSPRRWAISPSRRRARATAVRAASVAADRPGS